MPKPKVKDRSTIINDHQYEALRHEGMSKQKAARIEVAICGLAENPPTGAGEPGIVPIAPANANALRSYGLNDRSCLEIGCGAGRLTRQLSGAFREILAIDVSSDMMPTRERIQVVT